MSYSRFVAIDTRFISPERANGLVYEGERKAQLCLDDPGDLLKTNWFLALFILGAFLTAPAAHTQAHVKPNNICGDCGDDPGGGGGGGGGTPVVPHVDPGNPAVGGTSIGWTYQGEDSSANMGGILAREAPGATVFGGQMAMAYANRTWQDDYNLRDAPVVFRTPSFNGTITANTGSILSSGTPALLPVTINSTPSVLLAVNTRVGGGFQTRLYYTTSLSLGSWTELPTSASIPASDYSPTLTQDDTYIYLGLRNQADQTVTVCRTPVTAPTSGFSCYSHPGTRQINFNPGVASSSISGSYVLYMGYEEMDNTHELRVFTSSDQGLSISENTDISAGGNDDQSSVGPNLVAYNNALYVGFRTNDGDHKFLYRTSLNGTNYSKMPDPQLKIGSSPTLVSGFGLTTNPSTLYMFSSSEHNPDTDPGTSSFCYIFGCTTHGNRTTDETLSHYLTSWMGHP